MRILSDGLGAYDVQVSKPILGPNGVELVLKSSFVCSMVFSLICIGLAGCPADEAPELSVDAAARDDASVETADESNKLTSLDAGAELEDASQPDAAVSGSTRKPARSAPDAGAPDAAEPDASNDEGSKPAQPSTPASPAMTPAQGEIETVMMYLVYQLGIGGGLTPNPRPIILFKDGSATTDINFVVRDLDVPTHKSMFPETWTEWKVVDGKVARKKEMNWTSLDFQLKYPPNPSSLTFDDTFEHLSGATIGETTAFSQRSVRFFPDHKVIWGSTVGVTGPNVVFGSFPPDQRGTYQIDGYAIEFKWDDGKTTRSSFVWNEQDPGAVFIAGAGYVASN